jgi:peptidoglycan/LPS O-acetylase OafA/YrhL
MGGCMNYTWSLAVQVQFYLLCPIVLLLLMPSIQGFRYVCSPSRCSAGSAAVYCSKGHVHIAEDVICEGIHAGRNLSWHVGLLLVGVWWEVLICAAVEALQQSFDETLKAQPKALLTDPVCRTRICALCVLISATVLHLRASVLKDPRMHMPVPLLGPHTPRNDELVLYIAEKTYYTLAPRLNQLAYGIVGALIFSDKQLMQRFLR